MTTAAVTARDPVPERLINRLVALAEQERRGELAALRRSLGHRPGDIAGAAAIVEPFLGEDPRPNRVETFYLVAGLFALHPVHSANEGNFGATLRRIRFREGSQDENLGVSRRFIAALDARPEALSVHLRNLVMLLRSTAPEAPVNYTQLVRDILRWDDPDRRVKRRWAAGFWGGPTHEGEQAAQASTTSDTESTKGD